MPLYDVIIIGAGPIGCRTAELIVKKGFKVLLIEEDKKIGRPLKCTGLVSWRIKDLVEDVPPEVFLNTIFTARFYSGESYIEIKSDKPMYVMDRQKFDEHIFKRAKENGAKFKLGTKFLDFKRIEEGVLVKTTKGNFATKILVGCDGAISTVAKRAGLKQPGNVLVGLQTTVKGLFERDVVEVLLDASPDFFGWVVPESIEKARIGIASKKNAFKHFKALLKRRVGKYYPPDVRGVIRYGLMKKTVADNLLVVGDAATQVKPFSGGGLVYGLMSAKIASIACIKALKFERFDEGFLKENYEKVWKEKLKWPIIKGMILRKLSEKIPTWMCRIVFNPLTKFIAENFDVDLL
ncbi:MAG: geranylgeranyl reductase family protein [Candidatus Aenigmarchaeota archaeon]|nr:geranylgeranyl reductase family protein [Candidatus Aenigmarchaeota archaeon]